MKLMPVLLAFAFSVGSVYAADGPAKEKRVPSPAQQAQQEKMKSCNADAKKNALKGDDRKKFMSECLSAKSSVPAAAPAAATQQSKMKACNAQAGEKALKGNDRKAFMSECLKGSAE